MLVIQGQIVLTFFALMLALGVTGKPSWKDPNQVKTSQTTSINGGAVTPEIGRKGPESQGTGRTGPESQGGAVTTELGSKGPGSQGKGRKSQELGVPGGQSWKEAKQLNRKNKAMMSQDGAFTQNGNQRSGSKGKGNMKGFQGETLSCNVCEDVSNSKMLEACPKKMARKGSHQCYTEVRMVNNQIVLSFGVKNNKFCSKAPGSQGVWGGQTRDKGVKEEEDAEEEEEEEDADTTLCRICCDEPDCNDGYCPNVARISKEETSKASSLSTSLVKTQGDVEQTVCGKLIDSFTCDKSFVSKSCPTACANKMTETAKFEPTAEEEATADISAQQSPDSDACAGVLRIFSCDTDGIAEMCPEQCA